MKITERLQQAISENQAKFPENQDFQELSEFYKEMQRKGLLIKKEYEIPPLDTIGRIIYRPNHQNNISETDK